MSNILFQFDQIYELSNGVKQPIKNALQTLKSLDQNGHGLALSVTKNEEGLVVTTCGTPLLETMGWLHQKGVNNFNAAIANPKTVPDLVTMEDLFDSEVPDPLTWYKIANKLVDKKFIKFTDFT